MKMERFVYTIYKNWIYKSVSPAKEILTSKAENVPVNLKSFRTWNCSRFIKTQLGAVQRVEYNSYLLLSINFVL